MTVEVSRQSLHPVQVHVYQYQFVELQQRQVSIYFEEDGFSSGDPLLGSRAGRHTDEIRHSPWPLHELSTLTIFILDTLAGQRASPLTYRCQFYSLCLKHSPYSELSPLSSGQCGVNGWRGQSSVTLQRQSNSSPDRDDHSINFYDSANITVQLTLTH